MGKDNKTFLALTIIAAIISLNVYEIFSDSFFNNLITIPIWLFGCFMLSGLVFIIPYFIIDYLSKSISNYFLTVDPKKKKVIIAVTIIIIWLALSILGACIH